MNSYLQGLLLGLPLLLVPLAVPLAAQEPDGSDLAKKFTWRSLGPATMSGRITDISVYERDPKIWFVATASGGLLKTVNNGTTFEHQFDREKVVSIGAVCVSQSDPQIVWVGTGEENPRNSVSYGDGVYKSVDGGKTWKNMGLSKSFQIGAVVIHPTNPDVVYVGALGRLYGPNEERGLYKTTDGGKTWNKIHFVDEKTGVIDIKMHPNDPDTLIFATYERQRDGFDTNAPAKKIAPGSGLYRTRDGGKTIEKLTRGLPTNNFGRVGIDFFRKNPDRVYAIVECEWMGRTPENVGWSGLVVADSKAGPRVASVPQDSPAEQAGIAENDIVVALNGKPVQDARKLIEAICQNDVGAGIEISYKRGDETRKAEIKLAEAPRRGQGGPGGRGGRGGGGNRFRGGGNRERTWGGPVTFSGRLGGSEANLQGLQGKDSFQYGGIFQSDDGGTTWNKINSFDPRPMYFSQIRVDPRDSNHLYVLGISGASSTDGGYNFESGPFRGVHADHHAMWIDPNDGDHMILGCDGGIYVSYDRTKTWAHLNHAAIGQFYHVAVGPRRDYWVYGGLQDNGSWGAPSLGGSSSGAVNEDWIRIGGGDGFLVAVDENDPDQLYYESQNGATGRTNLRTGERGSIRYGSRDRDPRGAQGGTQGAIARASQRGGTRGAGGRRGGGQRGGGGERGAAERGAGERGAGERGAAERGTGERGAGERGAGERGAGERGAGQRGGGQRGAGERGAGQRGGGQRGGGPAGGLAGGGFGGGGDGGYRHNWRTPFMLSQHNSKIYYKVGNHVFRSLDKGNNLKIVSPEITTSNRGSGTAIAESPLNADVLYAGTDDGGLWMTRKGDHEWVDLRKAKPDAKKGVAFTDIVKKPMWISGIEASRYSEGRVYVTVDAHRSDDDDPYVLVSEDYGHSWTSLRGDLPRGSTRCIREDRVNEDLLYLGTEFGLFISLDRGKQWIRFHNNLPTVAVHEIAQHASCGDIVAATHGRSLWSVDITPLRSMTRQGLAQDVLLCQPAEVIQWRSRTSRGSSGGASRFVGEMPGREAEIYFNLKQKPGKIALQIKDVTGKVIRDLDVKPGVGLNKVTWDGRPNPRNDEDAQPDFSRFRGRGGRFGRGGATPGTYTVALTVDGETKEAKFQISRDPRYPDDGSADRGGDGEDDGNDEEDRDR